MRDAATRRAFLTGGLAIAAVSATAPRAALAQKTYGPGVTETTIKLGQTAPYSGPVAIAATFARAQTAYFQMVNDQGGINGRKVNLISLDDAFSPPKTVEQTRRLVEGDEVLFMAGSVGTATNSAVHRYLNTMKVPQLFLGSGATKWGDPGNFPWTMGWPPSYQSEGRIYAKYVREHVKEPRVGILYQNDDLGKDIATGLRLGLGEAAPKLIVKELSHEVTDASIDSQIVNLRAAGANVLLIATTQKFAALALRKSADLGWSEHRFLAFISSSVAGVLTPAGLDKAAGTITLQFVKDPTDPRWSGDAGVRDFLAFLKKYYPEGSPADSQIPYGLSIAQTTAQVIRQCGDELTRENVMRQAANLRNLELPMLLPGIRINTGATDFFPMKQAQLARFDGKSWQLLGEMLSS